jgi:hypothetical protein
LSFHCVYAFAFFSFCLYLWIFSFCLFLCMSFHCVYFVIARCLTKNSSAIVEIEFERTTCVELYSEYKDLGRFMLRSGGHTIAAGLIEEVGFPLFFFCLNNKITLLTPKSLHPFSFSKLFTLVYFSFVVKTGS